MLQGCLWFIRIREMGDIMPVGQVGVQLGRRKVGEGDGEEEGEENTNAGKGGRKEVDSEKSK